MGLAERAELVARLSLKDDFSGKLKGVSRSVSKLGVDMGKIGKMGQQGLSNAAKNLGRIGVVAGGIVALGVKAGISSLAELEDATTSVDGAIKQMGLTGQITSGQVAKWANEIEANVQAAFDDKEITAAATTLLRYGKVAPQSLQETLVVMTDLAAKTGSVDSAASKLAKSLADPTKATRVLREVGVTLTEEQQKQIKLWVQQGKLGKAQALILKEVGKQTKGAAAAMKGPYNDAMNILADITEDAQRALGEAFLPVLGKVADKLSTFLGDEANVEKIRSFGKDLAGGFEKVLAFGQRIPWDTIGASLKLAGAGAKAVFDAFTSLPPWVQTAVLTGWGLNKLSGGMLGGIVGELGKGLIKGVLGMNAAVVNINAGTVNGGTGGATPVGGGGTGVLGNLMKILGVTAVAGLASEFSDELTGFGTDLRKQIVGENFPTISASELEWPFGPKNTPSILPELLGGNGLLGGTSAPGMNVGEKVPAAQQRANDKITTGIERLRDIALAPPLSVAEREALAKIERKNERVYASVEKTKAAIDWSKQAVVSAQVNGAAAIVAAIRGIQLNVNVPLSVNVTDSRITRTYQTGTTLARSSANSAPGDVRPR